MSSFVIFPECGNEKASCCAIGPAGEKTVNMACIMTNNGRAAGRGGSGALMGSKKLKAIYVYGDQKVEIPDEDKWQEVVSELTAKITENPATEALKNFLGQPPLPIQRPRRRF